MKDSLLSLLIGIFIGLLISAPIVYHKSYKLHDQIEVSQKLTEDNQTLVELNHKIINQTLDMIEVNKKLVSYLKGGENL